MNFKSTFDTDYAGSKRFFFLFLVTIFLTVGYHSRAQADNTIEGTVSLPSPDVVPLGGLSVYVQVWDQNSGAGFGAMFSYPRELRRLPTPRQ